MNIVPLFSGVEPVMIKEVAGWDLWWPDKEINTLSQLHPGNAYFVLMESEAIITFPDCPYKK